MSAGGDRMGWVSATLREIWEETAAARRRLLAEVRDLTEAQLAFQPAPGQWSIGEILDHLCLAEQSIARVLSRILQQAAGRGLIGGPGSLEAAPQRIDQALYDAPAAAPESVRPMPGLPLPRLLAGLEASRERLLQVSGRADGRAVGNVTIPHFQLGELDFYQWLALPAAHEAKHLAQIRRIKARPDFPRS